MGKKRPLKTVALAIKMGRKSLAKVKQPKLARVEFRAGVGLQGPEKPGWTAGSMEKYPENVKTSNKDKITANIKKSLLEVLSASTIARSFVEFIKVP